MLRHDYRRMSRTATLAEGRFQRRSDGPAGSGQHGPGRKPVEGSPRIILAQEPHWSHLSSSASVRRGHPARATVPLGIRCLIRISAEYESNPYRLATADPFTSANRTGAEEADRAANHCEVSTILNCHGRCAGYQFSGHRVRDHPYRRREAGSELEASGPASDPCRPCLGPHAMSPSVCPGRSAPVTPEEQQLLSSESLQTRKTCVPGRSWLTSLSV